MTPLAYGWAKVIDKMGFTQEVDHFFDCLSNDKEPLTSVADAYKTQELMHRILTTAGLPRFWNEVSGLFKIAGHTMGTPEYTFAPTLELFHHIGLDGAEIVVQDIYRCAIPQQADLDELNSLRRQADKLGLRIIALTPYYSRFNDLSSQVREKEIDGLTQVIGYAKVMGSRIYSNLCRQLCSRGYRSFGRKTSGLSGQHAPLGRPRSRIRDQTRHGKSL